MRRCMRTGDVAPAHAGPIPQLRLYREWLEHEHGLTFEDYAALWQWSTTDLTRSGARSGTTIDCSRGLRSRRLSVTPGCSALPGSAARR